MAAACFRTVLALQPDHFLALNNLGLILFEQGDIEQALEQFQAIVNIAPELADAQNNLGNAWRRLGDLENAIACFKKAISLEPGSIKARFNLGNALQENSQLDAAVEQYEAALRIDPQNADLIVQLGIALQKLARLDAARAQYELALRFRPNAADVLINLGGVLQKQGKFDEAITCYQKVPASDPRKADAIYNVGTVLDVQSKIDDRADGQIRQQQVDAAIMSYRAALELQPNHMHALSNLGVILQREGKFEEAMTCYLRVLSIEENSLVARFNLGKLHHERNELELAAEQYRRALAVEPNNVDSNTQLGLVFQAQERFDLAISHFQIASEIAPDRADLQLNLGHAFQKNRHFESARKHYLKALELDPDYVPAHFNLGTLIEEQAKGVAGAERRQMLNEALRQYQICLDIDPRHVDSHVNKGAVLMALMRNADALVSCRQALMIDPKNPIARLNVGLLSLLTGDFETGWHGYAFRHIQRQGADPYLVFNKPLWLNDADISGKTILLCCEQGLGDTIHFLRYVELVAALGPANVILEIQGPLKPLMAQFHEPIKVFVEGEVLPPFDFYCPLPTLPLAFKTTLDNIPSRVPYVAALEDRRVTWFEKMSSTSKPKIGVVWSGNAAFGNDFNRSMTLQALAELFEMTQFHFFSLQKDIQESDAVLLRHFDNVTDLSPLLRDFADTASVIDSLELVISVDTAVAHLAGALGKRVWIMLPFAPDFRWMTERSDSPWYPSARLFRQKEIGDWGGLLQDIRHQLALEYGAHA
ncbi:MAG TPA: tetratricopeptide repeat protein [Methylobacter sp.]